MPRLLALLACLTVMVCAVPALAAQSSVMGMPEVAPGNVPIRGEYWALIVGIDKYTRAPPLETAVKDATGVRDVLLTRYGFKRERIVELLNEQATRTGIEEALYTLGQRVGAEDSVFIYYAGHGQYSQDGRLGWWVPVEGKPQSPGTFITNASVRDYITGMKAKHVYLVADSCFSGALFGGSRTLPPLNDQFFSRLYANRSRWGLTSGGTEPVADRGKEGHSVFAYYFIKLLKENADPYLVPSRIFDQIAPIIANNSDQSPRSEPLKGAGDEGGQFVFRLMGNGSGEATGTSGSLFQTLRQIWRGGSRGTDSSELQAARERLQQEREALERERRETAELAALENERRRVEDERRRVQEERRRKEADRKQIEVASVTRPSPSEQLLEIAGKDGAPMLLIPAGEFVMGSHEGEPDERPIHRVTASAFYLDKYEVTNAQFARFVEATGAQSEWQTEEADGRDRHPVVNVTWHDADAYCRWAEKRLPTEAEWEYAVRGTEGRTYPWGNTWDARRARIKGDNESDGTAPVGSFPNGASPFGVLDLAGNVWEWTADWYNSTYYRTSPRDNPKGPANGAYRVLRGGSWGSVSPKMVRSTNRLSHRPRSRSDVFGFRCARTP